MSYSAKILADSVNPRGVRLITFEVSFPRIVLAEFNTHRVFSRNSASSRAIPIATMLRRVRTDPFVPSYIGRNQKGMQAHVELDGWRRKIAVLIWRAASKGAVFAASMLARLGAHKQLANRLLEPFLWHTVIVTSTEWANFFALRCSLDAQPEIREIAMLMRTLYEHNEGKSKRLIPGEWHLPLVTGLDWADETESHRLLSHEELARVSSARCARVSYLTHDGRRSIADDLALANRLQDSGHMSPFEHACRAEDHDEFIGNIRGFTQLRKLMPDEAVFRARSSVAPRPPSNGAARV